MCGGVEWLAVGMITGKQAALIADSRSAVAELVDDDGAALTSLNVYAPDISNVYDNTSPSSPGRHQR